MARLAALAGVLGLLRLPSGDGKIKAGRATRLMEKAATTEAQGKVAEAIALHRSAYALANEMGPGDLGLRMKVEFQLADCLFRAGQRKEAVKVFQTLAKKRLRSAERNRKESMENNQDERDRYFYKGLALERLGSLAAVKDPEKGLRYFLASAQAMIEPFQPRTWSKPRVPARTVSSIARVITNAGKALIDLNQVEMAFRLVSKSFLLNAINLVKHRKHQAHDLEMIDALDTTAILLDQVLLNLGLDEERNRFNAKVALAQEARDQGRYDDASEAYLAAARLLRNQAVDTFDSRPARRQLTTSEPRFDWGGALRREGKIWAVSLAVFGGGIWVFNTFFKDRSEARMQDLVKAATAMEEQHNLAGAALQYREARDVVQQGRFTLGSRMWIDFRLADCLAKAGSNGEATQLFTELANQPLPSSGSSKRARKEENRMRLSKGLALERLGQKAHDQGLRVEALQRYVAALEALLGHPSALEAYEATPSGLESEIPESRSKLRKVPPRMARATAGILNNIAMVFLEQGELDRAEAVLARCGAVLKDSSLVSDSEGLAESLDQTRKL
ncbi:Hypothetical protein SCF082_LOCUS21323, partial [Durusdinium trenchii]